MVLFRCNIFQADLLDCSGSSEDVFDTGSKKQGAIVGKLFENMSLQFLVGMSRYQNLSILDTDTDRFLKNRFSIPYHRLAIPIPLM